MLVVILRSKSVVFEDNRDGTRVLSFHVGFQKELDAAKDKFRKNLDAGVTEVARVSADGHELQNVLGQLHNIPYAEKNPVQEWTGDMANFIFLNVRLDGYYTPEKFDANTEGTHVGKDAVLVD